jgi:hypothetical protein
VAKQPKGSGGGGTGGGGGGSPAPHKHGSPKTPVKHLPKKTLEKRRKAHEARVKTKAYKKSHAKAVLHERKLRKERKAVAPRLGLQYVLGQNNILDTCTATAVANSFYVATDIVPCDDDVLRLYSQCAKDFDHSIEGTLNAVMIYGFMGARPIISPTNRQNRRPGLILGVAHYNDPHTVVSIGDEWITWGGKVPACPICIEEVWHVGWLS